MRVGSLFAGIGGFDLGFERAGMQTAWQVEIDPKCRELLAARFPHARQYEDVREVGAANLEPVDVICGGFPCQDLSVAGKRAGLAGARSGLFYEMARVVDELKPAWFVWENVPGLLSSNSGADFAAVLVELERIGHLGAWSTLDARYFGVAQRRRRIFGVFARGDSGAERAAQVLALSARMRGNPAPRREAREVGTLAPSLANRVGGGGGLGTDAELDGALIPREWPADVAPTLNTAFGTKQGLEDQNALGGGGMFVPVVGALHTASGRASTTTEDAQQLVPTVTSKWAKGSGGPAGSETSNLVATGRQRHACQCGAVLVDGRTEDWGERGVHGPNGCRVGDANTVRAREGSGAARGDGHDNLVAQTLRVGGCDQGAGDSYDNTPIVAQPVRSNPHNNSDPTMEASMHVQQASGVRRLTPTECERLQGFPDGWTAGFSDTHRYRMLGNAVAVPCAAWIGRRIMSAGPA